MVFLFLFRSSMNNLLLHEDDDLCEFNDGINDLSITTDTKSVESNESLILGMTVLGSGIFITTSLVKASVAAVKYTGKLIKGVIGGGVSLVSKALPNKEEVKSVETLGDKLFRINKTIMELKSHKFHFPFYLEPVLLTPFAISGEIYEDIPKHFDKLHNVIGRSLKTMSSVAQYANALVDIESRVSNDYSRGHISPDDLKKVISEKLNEIGKLNYPYGELSTLVPFGSIKNFGTGSNEAVHYKASEIDAPGEVILDSVALNDMMASITRILSLVPTLQMAIWPHAEDVNFGYLGHLKEIDPDLYERWVSALTKESKLLPTSTIVGEITNVFSGIDKLLIYFKG